MGVVQNKSFKEIHESGGIQGMIKAIYDKFFKPKSTYYYSFERIAREVTSNVSESWRANPEVYKRLGEGVFYAYGMRVEGDIAEFGTMTGRTAVALAAAVNSCGVRNKKLWLFDSFEGLPEAMTDIDRFSPHVVSGIWGKGSCKGMSPESLLRLTSKYLDKNSIVIIKGWFKDTVPEIPQDTKFALVHVDGDLYESAIDVLDNLFSRNMISKGAQVFFDDWNCNAADPNFGERRAWKEMVEKFNIQFSDQGSYGTAGHRFIVHSYTSI
jgi:O-methyltransferase